MSKTHTLEERVGAMEAEIKALRGLLHETLFDQAFTMSDVDDDAEMERIAQEMTDLGKSPTLKRRNERLKAMGRTT